MTTPHAGPDLSALTSVTIAERYPDSMSAGRLQPLWLGVGIVALFASIVGGLLVLDISWPRFFGGFGELTRIGGLMLPPEYGTSARLWLWLHSLSETLAIALLGTLAAAMLAFPVSLLAARNVMPAWIVRFFVRRSLDSIRGVNTLIWALIWINVVGLGPFAGVLAIMTTDFGTFGKLFSEAIEATDKKGGEGVIATGGSDLHRIRFGLLPQVFPVLLSQILYLLESNTRSATIIGIVGAGGIGQHLTEAIRTLEWQQVSFLVLLILVTVAIIDTVSRWIRHAMIGEQATASPT
jgi:phosphonate transport system permease protein